MSIYDVVIIGSGPSGLFCALNIDSKNKKVLLIEKNSSPGKKLLISGLGQCNFTHEGEIDDFFNHYGDNAKFLKYSLLKVTNKDIIQFVEKRGLKATIMENGKVFPESLNAEDFVELLVNECEENNVKFNYNTDVTNISYNNNLYNIVHNKGSYLAKNIVIATGGKSYPVTGSTGDGYIFGKKLGHKIVEPKEALTPIIVENYEFDDMSGISFQKVPISIWRDNKKLKSFNGDILLTHKGVSGPGIINNSRYMINGDIVKISFINYDNIEIFRNTFKEEIDKNGKLLVKTILKKLDLPKRIIDKIFNICNIEENILCSQINKKMRNLLFSSITEYPFRIKRFGGFHLAMATRGGISLKDVNPNTMESRKLQGLYFIGEVLDIDGDTGGYNIQAALSTGAVAAMNINKKLS